MKGGDCIEISPTCAPLLKKKMRGRIAKILPFRCSRKKIVTPSLTENWCSFERLFTREKPSLQSREKSSMLGKETVSMQGEEISCSMKNMETFSLLHFAEQKATQNARIRDTLSQNVSIKQDKIVVNPALMQNFSLMRDHLQSIWEKSVYSQVVSLKHFAPQNVRMEGSLSNKLEEERIKNKNHLYETLSAKQRENLHASQRENLHPLNRGMSLCFAERGFPLCKEISTLLHLVPLYGRTMQGPDLERKLKGCSTAQV